MKVVVTGGAGFLGSHVARRLGEDGHEVSVVDDLSSGSRRNLSDQGLRTDIVLGDLKGYGFAKRSLKGADAVFHFAAEVGSVSYLHGTSARELASLQSNLTIDTNVFRACIENGVRLAVYASSVSVYPYGEQQGSRVRFREEDSERKVDPEGGYGWSKYIAEKQLGMMSTVSSGVARIFHAYGPNIYLKPDRSQVIASLLRKAVRYPREGFTVWGDGSQRRCFVYIDDAVEALMRLFEHVRGSGSLTVNIGSTEEITVGELARKVVELSGKRIPISYDPSKPTGALNRMPDLTRAKEVLGWRPGTPLADGLAKTYSWVGTRLAGRR